MKTFQRMICISNKCHENTPTDVMKVILWILPMDIYIDQARLTAYRLYCYDQWTTNGYDTGHNRILTRAQTIKSELLMLSDRMVKMASFDRKFSVIIPNRDEWYKDGPIHPQMG